MRLYRSS